MENIKHKISKEIAKKILGSQDNASEYLLRLNDINTIPSLTYRTVSKGKDAGKKVLKLNTEELWNLVETSWDYEHSKSVIREMFRNTEKYRNGKNADVAMSALISEWHNLSLGDISWPFSQGAFDEFVQKVNSEKDGSTKDDKVRLAAVKYRRIKEINTVRNDFIETLIFEKNDNILPTLNHRRGVDFFIDGESFDQKVAKSPTAQFKAAYKDSWKEQAIATPELVAKYLYEYQDEGRFGADPRLLVVYLDEDVSIDRIRDTIGRTNLAAPLQVSFTYGHKSQGAKEYTVSCFVILLHH